MRILFSCTAADGHFLPLLPLARAAAAQGHDVAFATSPHFASRVRDAGFACLGAGISLDELEDRFAPTRERLRSTDDLTPEERRVLAFSGRFAAIEAPGKLDDLQALVGEWRPNAIVHESADLAAPIVAAAAGLPSVHHSFGRIIPAAALRRAADVVAPLWQRAGLDPDEWAGAYRGTYVDIWPRSLQDERVPPPTPTFPLRPAEGRDARDARRLVYVTLGTIFNRLDIFRDLLGAFAPLDCDVVLTVGANLDPAALEPVPPNALVKRYVPQAEILPRAHAVVTHGGSGSTLGALAHGCPILFVPQGADQFENAGAVARGGAGVVVAQQEQTVEGLRAGLARLLDDDAYASAASRVAAEIAAMPAADQVATELFGA